MKRPFIMGSLVYFLAGCAAFTPANSNTRDTPLDPTPDYREVVSDPLDGLLPPPRLKDLELPEGSRLEDPLDNHLNRMKDYREYVDRSIKSVEELIKQDDAHTSEVRLRLEGATYDCSLPPIPQIDLGTEPSPDPVDAMMTETDIASAALAYASKLSNYQKQVLKTIEEGVTRYNKECGL